MILNELRKRKKELREEYNLKCNQLEEVYYTISEKSLEKKKRERKELQIEYEIEKQKIENHKRVLQASLDVLEAEEKEIRTLSQKYTMANKMNDVSIEDMQENAQNLQQQFNQQMEQLDVLSTQNALAKQFSDIRNRKCNILSELFVGLGFAVIELMLFYIRMRLGAVFFLNEIWITVGGAFIGGCCVSSINESLKIQKRKSLFQKFNDKLKEKALSDTCKDIDEKELEKRLEEKIMEASQTQLQLQEQKQILQTKIEEERKTKELQEVSSIEQNITMEYGISAEELGRQKTKQYR